LKLRLLAAWTPTWVISEELKKVQDVTVGALSNLLRESGQNVDSEAIGSLEEVHKNINELRMAMAQQQATLVEALAEALGPSAAIEVGRETLFVVGQQLGRQSRDRLGVGSSRGDLERAARIMYRVLGINFQLKWQGTNEADVVVTRCALAQHYSMLTCMVLSATDEGVVNGLNPNTYMKFEKHITDGCKTCIAKIKEERRIKQ